MTHEEFLQVLEAYYREHGRHDLPWRSPEPDGTFDPYKILVSEVMLQQTQVARVVPKYAAFLERFPDIASLAAASMGDVLRVWQGLGYNRRAKYLWQTAQQVTSECAGQLPDGAKALEHLPGIGRNTAGALLAYAFNKPALFIETNIRTVYIHHFFRDHIDVPDQAILGLLEQTLDRVNPREFYWALMDYGSYLKQTVGNLSRASRGYIKQSQFHGSRRQIRGQILRQLAAGPQTKLTLERQVADERLAPVLESLKREGLICKTGGRYRLP
ncbi:MAG TPA: A/G-specific adenine glycosylase [Verrucomicrobiae bacterium]|nr:A/G-specific adenine glycosylase [Verrucomicrobiae bacterium]